MLAHSYTPIVHLDPLLASIKGRSRALMWGGGVVAREDGLTNRLALSPSRMLVTPTASASPLAQDNTSRVLPPLCSISRQPIWAGTRSDNFTHRSKDLPGSKCRQIYFYVGGVFASQVCNNNTYALLYPGL
jgi:hypothetical protein